MISKKTITPLPSVPQKLELIANGVLRMLYRAGPVCRVDSVEVPLQDLRYGRLAPLAIPHEGLRWTHRLRQHGKRRQINTEGE